MPLAQRSAGCAIAAVAAIAAHADRGAYIGVRASGNAYDVDYSKAVDNTSPVYIGTHAGRVFRFAAATDGTTWDAGLSAGYRLPFDAFYVDLEADAVLHRRSVSSRLAGRGTSPGRDQLGELWPENWSLEKSRSFGITARLGRELPTFRRQRPCPRRRPPPGCRLRDCLPRVPVAHGVSARKNASPGEKDTMRPSTR